MNFSGGFLANEFQALEGRHETLFEWAKFSQTVGAPVVDVEAADDGRWWAGDLVDSVQKDGKLFHLVKCPGFNVEVGTDGGSGYMTIKWIDAIVGSCT